LFSSLEHLHVLPIVACIAGVSGEGVGEAKKKKNPEDGKETLLPLSQSPFFRFLKNVFFFF